MASFVVVPPWKVNSKIWTHNHAINIDSNFDCWFKGNTILTSQSGMPVGNFVSSPVGGLISWEEEEVKKKQRGRAVSGVRYRGGRIKIDIVAPL